MRSDSDDSHTAPTDRTSCRSGPCVCDGISKPCKDCGVVKPLSEFTRHKETRDGHLNSCKACRYAYVEQWKRNNPEATARHRAVQRANRDWKRQNVPGYKEREAVGRSKEAMARASRKHLLKKKYGLTLEAFDQLVADQRGACAICQQPQEGKPMHVDHCHATGVVRGLLCSPCNTALGLLGDDPARMRAAAEYVERKQVT